ncbi:MAG: hypothetical protein AAFQ27_13515, partial [Pseudomonadota bacterium]
MIKGETAWEAAMNVWAEAARLVRSALGYGAVYLAGTIGFWSLIDFGIVGEDYSIIGSIVDFALGYLLTVGLLTSGGLLPDGMKGTFGTYFAVSLISGIAILLGLVALVIPGVFLMVRWLPAYGFALAQESSATDALGASWAATEGAFWPLFLAMFIPLFAVLAPVVPVLLYDLSAILSEDAIVLYDDMSDVVVFAFTILSSLAA